MKFYKDAAEEDSNSYLVLPAGTYDFDVEKVEYVTSKSGTMNWKLTLDFETPEGKHAKVFEYFPEKVSMVWKFAQFFKCIGFEPSGDEYDTDDMRLAAGEVGRAQLVIEAGTNGYQDRNKVKRYLPRANTKPEAPVITSDDLPF